MSEDTMFIVHIHTDMLVMASYQLMYIGGCHWRVYLSFSTCESAAYWHLKWTKQSHTQEQHQGNKWPASKASINKTNWDLMLTRTPNTTVEMAPPMKPSHVFLGDSLMSGVRPKKKPNMYAIMSLQMIMETGTRNLTHRHGSTVTPRWAETISHCFWQ